MRRVFFLCCCFVCSAVFGQGNEAPVTVSPATAVLMEQARSITASLDDNTLAAQLLLTSIDGRSSLPSSMKNLLERIPAGGIMFFRYNLDSSKEDAKKLLSEAAEAVSINAGIPPFMAVDHEGGLVHRFGPGVERLPSAYSFWQLAQREGRAASLARAETLYRRSAEEIRELGINLVLAPLAETLNNENRVFLETRSYGPDHDFTEEAALVFIKSMDASGIAATLKHFPGNSAVDPHYGVASLDLDKKQLDEMVKPFAGIIDRIDVPFVMLSHVKLPALDGRHASLSRTVIQDWLRGELGFEGIVLADDYSMGAVSASGQRLGATVVEALNAGVDMIMVWPRDLSAVHAFILEAVREGRLSRERLRDAATRIIAVKLRYFFSP